MTTVVLADVVAEARRWIGTPFVRQSAVRGVGCDCAGLIVGVAIALKLVSEDFDLGPYRQQPDRYRMVSMCDQYMSTVLIRDLKPGHVVQMQFDREPQHLGILVDYPQDRLGIVHALTNRAVIEHRLDAVWRLRIVGAYCFPGIN